MESIALFNTVSSNSRSWNIYLKLTDKTTFINNTDWIAVTEDDLYYSGTVALSDNEWTYIKLDKKFSYDGLLNLAIIIDDNTNNTRAEIAFATAAPIIPIKGIRRKHKPTLTRTEIEWTTRLYSFLLEIAIPLSVVSLMKFNTGATNNSEKKALLS